MSDETGIRGLQKRNRRLLNVLGLIVVIGLESCGSSARLASFSWNAEDRPKSPHEQARDARAKSVARARAALETAKAAGAEWAAPYDYYAAEEFLALAKEELDSGDVTGVALFASESGKHSALAMGLPGPEDPPALRSLSGRDGRIAAKLAEAEALGAASCSPRELARARVALANARHEATERHYPARWTEAGFSAAEEAADRLLEGRRQAALAGAGTRFRCFSRRERTAEPPHR